MVGLREQIETRHQAYMALAEWAKQASPQRRDEVIRQAREAGIRVSEIAVCVRLSRGQVYKIISDGKARDAQA